MRVLIIMGPGVTIDPAFLTFGLKEQVTMNSYPKGEGIALFDANREPKWDWPTYTIVVGDVNIGKHHADMRIPKGQDASTQIVDQLSILQDADVVGTDDAE